MAPAVRGQTVFVGRSDGSTPPPSLVDPPIAVQVRNRNGAVRCSCVLCALRQARVAWEEAVGVSEANFSPIRLPNQPAGTVCSHNGC